MMAPYLRQGTLRFVPGYKLQTQWGLPEAMVFALESAGAPLIAFAIHGSAGMPAVMTGLVMVCVAVALLMLHLGRPRRAWRAMLSVRHSWISRGTLALGSVVVLTALYLVLALLPDTTHAGPPSSVAQMLAVLLGCLGLFVGVYPGLVLSSSPAIGFWNSGLLPVLSLLQGVCTAVLIAFAFPGGAGTTPGGSGAWAAVWLLAALALALALYIASMLRRGAAAAESARYLLRGCRAQFAVVACLLGIGLPLALAAWAALGGTAHLVAVYAAAALARLGGDIALRHAFLKVGMFDPVI